MSMKTSKITIKNLFGIKEISLDGGSVEILMLVPVYLFPLLIIDWKADKVQ